MCSCSSGTKSPGESAEEGGAGAAGTSGSSGSGGSGGTKGSGGSGASSGSSGAGNAGTDTGGSAGVGGTRGGSAGQSGGGQGGSGAQGGAGGAEGGSRSGGAGAGGTSMNPYRGCEGEDTMNNSCSIAGSFCHPTFGCEPPCPSGTASCPAPPAGGTATPYCQDRFCRLDCTLDKTCPAGMTCHEVNQFCTGNPL
jgi:hypothetical protein